MLAGAKTLVISLWKVPDRETRDLMIEFFARLPQGAEPCDALRRAQLALKARLPDPQWWGGFICQGGELRSAARI